MPEKSESIAQPSVCLALTFLFIGLSYAIPTPLLHPAEVQRVSSFMATEVANVYALTAWAGMAHFIYAYRGQVLSLRATRVANLLPYALAVVVVLASLLGARALIGVGPFGAITWTYFIFHFHRAEAFFSGNQLTKWDWRDPMMVILTFAWLSVVLLNPGNPLLMPWVIWLFSLGLAALVMANDGLERLMSGRERQPLLCLFFIGESLVWGTVGRFAAPSFLFGVYVFHIAAASYFHYFGSYFAAFHRGNGKDSWLRLSGVFLVNGCLIGLGLWVARSDPHPVLRPVLGVEWFTYWVAAHLVMSDLFPWLRRKVVGGQV